MTLHRQRWIPATVGLGAVGAALTLLAIAGPVQMAGVRVPPSSVPASARVMVLACAVSLLVSALCMPARWDRVELIASGLVALGALSVVVMTGSPLLIAILVPLLGALYATRPGTRPFAARIRNPGLAALFLGLGAAFLSVRGGPVLGQVGALGIALGLVALAGLAPYLDRFDPDEPTASSGLAWTAFFAPPLAMTVTMETLPTLQSRQAAIFATVCISLGLVNLAWGVLGAWRAPTLTSAWRRSFLADWGLVLMGFGLLVPSGRGLAGAFVCLLSLVLCRLPLYIYARSSLEEGNQTEGVSDPSSSGSLGQSAPSSSQGPGPSVRFSSARNLLVGLALAGAAPFAGFAGRLLLLDAAMQLAWPLALLLVVAMVGWLAHSFRLGAGLGRPQGRTAAGVGIVLAIGGVIGILPGLVLAIAGFGSFQL